MPSGVYERTPEMKIGKYERTPETKKKMREAKLKTWRDNPEVYDQRNKDISENQIGISLSPEHCKAISDGKSGIPLSEAHCEALSDAQTGIKHSPERNDRQSERMIGHTVSELSRIRSSATWQGISVDEWTGYTDDGRPWVEAENRCLKLNDRFKGCEMHHITKTIVIYIPKELHMHIRHDLRTGSNMGEMNVLAIQFLNGGLEQPKDL